MEGGGWVGGLRGSGVEAEGVLGASVWQEWYLGSIQAVFCPRPEMEFFRNKTEHKKIMYSTERF